MYMWGMIINNHISYFLKKSIIDFSNMYHKTTEMFQVNSPVELFDFSTGELDKLRVTIIWIGTFNHDFKLSNSAYLLSADFLYRYLSRIKDYDSNMELIGIACHHIASKIINEECLSVEDYTAISTYTAQEISKMEMDVFEVIKENINIFTPSHVLKLENGTNINHKISHFQLLIFVAQYMEPKILTFSIFERILVCQWINRKIEITENNYETLNHVLGLTKQGLLHLKRIKLSPTRNITFYATASVDLLLNNHFSDVKLDTYYTCSIYKPRTHTKKEVNSDIRFGKKIGSGMYGDVYYTLTANVPSVIKKYKNNEKGLRYDLLVEVALILSLNHPNLPSLISIAPNCIEMPYYGSPISTLKISRLPCKYKRNYFGQIVSAVNYINSLGIMHNDIKPSNILIEHHKITLIDFGISSIGCCKSLVQSYAYRAPEVLFGTGPAPETEVWALGCIWYEFIYGNPLCSKRRADQWITDFVSIFGVPQGKDCESIKMRDSMPNPGIYNDLIEQKKIRGDDLLLETLTLLPKDRMKIGKLHSIFEPFIEPM